MRSTKARMTYILQQRLNLAI